MVVSAAYRGFQVAKRLYSYGKPVITGKSFISKFPPQHRQTVRTVLKGTEYAFTGGLVSDILKDLQDDGTMNPNAVPKKSQFNKQYQAHNRYGRKSNFQRKHKCYCKGSSKRGYKYVRSRRR